MAMGTISLVATPLGNLEDITLRAIRVLRACDVVACEDTRRTGQLLKHLGIKKTLVSCHDHNERDQAEKIVERAVAGESVAVVSDAGTPAIADPGYRVVKAALARSVRVIPIPGPSAVITALCASGLPTDAFVFQGFLPIKKSRRGKTMERLVRSTWTTVLFEAPHRILGTLAELHELLGDRELVVAREMSKLHEEFLRGPAAGILEQLEARPAVRGEFVVLVGPDTADRAPALSSLPARVEQLMEEGVERMDAIKRAAKESGVSKRSAYASLHGQERKQK